MRGGSNQRMVENVSPRANFFVSTGYIVIRGATRLQHAINSFWSRDGEEERQARRIYLKVIAEAQRQKETGSLPDFDEIRKTVQRPTVSEITSAWVRRFIYLFLLLVSVGSNYILVSTRAPILFGGGAPPSWLRVLYPYLPVITGVFFVTIATLSGMLIEEHVPGLPDVVRIEPDLSPLERRIRLYLAIFMFLSDVVAVIFLTLGGLFQQFFSMQPAVVTASALFSISSLVFIGVFLGWKGFVIGAEGIAVLLVSVPSILLLALISLLFIIVGSVFQGIIQWRQGWKQPSKGGMSVRDVVAEVDSASKKVFISHSHKDAVFAHRLEQSLSTRGLVPWIDKSKLKGGDRWIRNIQSAIDESDAVITILSPDAVESEWVDMETWYAHDQHIPIIPILLRPCKVPIILSALHRIVFEHSEYEKPLADLFDAINTQTSH